MTSKQQLHAMIDALVRNNNEQAELDFQGYLTGKFSEILGEAKKADPKEPVKTEKPKTKGNKKKKSDTNDTEEEETCPGDPEVDAVGAVAGKEGK